MHTPTPPAPPPPSVLTTDAASFMTLIADALRLRNETLAMAFVYTNKYLHHTPRVSQASSEEDEELLDEHVTAPPPPPS
jgi:hypothetical protein